MRASHPLAIRAVGLGKRYRIGSGSPVASLLGGLRRLASGTSPPIGADDGQTLWALRDVSFEVARGESVGIVGHNGAGKSTLLKLLARITEPSAGLAEIHGRASSLLEVGTGFHPELTGRENVYLNGAILGMRHAEIRDRFDEIVDFSGVSAFLDTPVKRYSTGMRVRLAFAVAAHLESEILIIDEVLAVGDARFQRKCLGAMGDLASSGRTVLFVSHNLAAVRALCPRSLHLEDGRVRDFGPSEDVLGRYLAENGARVEIPLAERSDRSGDGRLRFTRLRVDGGAAGGQPLSGAPLRLAARYRCAEARPLKDLRVAFTLRDAYGNRLFAADTDFTNATFPSAPCEGEVACHIERLPLAPGSYWLDVWGAVAEEVADCVMSAGRFRVGAGDFFGTGRTTNPAKHGAYLVDHAWQIHDVEEAAP